MDYFWENDGWEKQDKHLRELEQMPFWCTFPFIPGKNGLYEIRGPRQVGKKSLVRTILSEKARGRIFRRLSD